MWVDFRAPRSVVAKGSEVLLDVATTILTLIGLGVVGWPVRARFRDWHVPPAVSLMALGALLGPSLFDILPEAWLRVTTVASKAAFVVLLLRAGIGFPIQGFRQVAGFAVVFGTIPVLCELLVVAGLTRALWFDSWEVAILCGFLIAAVSPAVVLPTMLAQKDAGRGSTRRVPDRLIGQTVINAFIAQTGILLLLAHLAPGADGDVLSRGLARLPIALVLGITGGALAGLAVGWVLGTTLARRRWVAAAAVLMTGIAVYFGIDDLAASAGPWFAADTVFAALAVGVTVRRMRPRPAEGVSEDLKQVWLLAEIVLFVNLGSSVDLGRLIEGPLVLGLLGVLAAALAVRVTSAAVLMLSSNLLAAERRYALIAHLPKATIQAVFGALPLATFTTRGQSELIDAGHTMLVMAAVAIAATAPVGAVLLDRLGERLLPVEADEDEPRSDDSALTPACEVSESGHDARTRRPAP